MKAREWIPSSKCCRPGCVMTLCTPIGGGQRLCWLHALRYLDFGLGRL